MNNRPLFLLSALFLLFLFSSHTLSDTYTIAADKSSMEWIGRKKTGEHSGTINLKSGELQLKKGKITGGYFVVDMTSIQVTDITDEVQNKKLLRHLENEDFFDTKNHMEARLDITGVSTADSKKYLIKGNLTIKNKTNPISFEATVTGQTKSVLIARATLIVDRTIYGIVYKSSVLGEAMINDLFELNVKLTAIKR